MMQVTLPNSGGLAPVTQPRDGDEQLHALARKVEANFLAEMLKQAGFGKARESFGGGEGEDQFASFLRQEQATAMVESGGIGLAESVFQALKESRDAGHGN